MGSMCLLVLLVVLICIQYVATQTPTEKPSSMPSSQPSSQPSSEPTSQPSSQPTSPTGQPSGQPTIEPTGQPTREPTGQPTSNPSKPSGIPTGQPSIRPSSQPSTQPSVQPTSVPSGRPSSLPSSQPSSKPSGQPTSIPTSSRPTGQPSSLPSSQPSSEPTSPTGKPSSQPSRKPSGQPSGVPTSQPSSQPTGLPSSQPSVQPSAVPSSQPSLSPSAQPSSAPSSPSGQPTSQPSDMPSSQPSGVPTSQPSIPTSHPSPHPTSRPSQAFRGISIMLNVLEEELDPDTMPEYALQGFINLQPSVALMVLVSMILLMLGSCGNCFDHQGNNRVKMQKLKAFLSAKAAKDARAFSGNVGINKEPISGADINQHDDSDENVGDHDVRPGAAVRPRSPKHKHTMNLPTYFAKVLDALFPPVFRTQYLSWQRGWEEMWYHHKLWTIFYVSNVSIPLCSRTRYLTKREAAHKTRPKEVYSLTPWLQSAQIATNANVLFFFVAFLFRFWRISTFGNLAELDIPDALLIMFLCSFAASFFNVLTDLLFSEVLAGPWDQYGAQDLHDEIRQWYRKHRILAEDWIEVDTQASDLLKSAVSAYRVQKIAADEHTRRNALQNRCLKKCLLGWIKHTCYTCHYVLPDSVRHLYEEAFIADDNISERLFDLSLHVMEHRARDVRLKASHTTLQKLHAPDGRDVQALVGIDGRPVPYRASQSNVHGASDHDTGHHGAWSLVTEMSDLVTKLMLQRGLIPDLSDLLHFDNVWGIHIGATLAITDANNHGVESVDRTVKPNLVYAHRELSDSTLFQPDVMGQNVCCHTLCCQGSSSSVQPLSVTSIENTYDANVMHSILLHFLQEAADQGRDMIGDTADAIASVGDLDKGEELIGFQLLQEFIVDLLGRGLQHSKIYLAHVRQETSRKRKKFTRAFKFIALFSLLVFNIAVIGLCAVVTRHEPSTDWQTAWAVLSSAALVFDLLITETVTTWIVHFAVPDFISSRIGNVREQVQQVIVRLISQEEEERLLKEEMGEEEYAASLLTGTEGEPGVSAPEFLYPSVRTARQVLFLPEAALIASYRSIYPGELFAQRSSLQTKPTTSNNLLGLCIVSFSFVVFIAKTLAKFVVDFLSGAVPTQVILHLGTFGIILQRLCVRLFFLLTVIVITGACGYLNMLFGLSGPAAYMIMIIALLYLVFCMTHWHRARKLANEQASIAVERTARQNKAVRLHHSVPHQSLALGENSRPSSSATSEFRDRGAGGISQGKGKGKGKGRQEKTKKGSKGKKVKRVAYSSSKESISDSSVSSEATSSSSDDSSIDLEGLSMLKEISTMLVQAERERDEAHLEHEIRLQHARDLRQKAFETESLAINPKNTHHSVPHREMTKADRIELEKHDNDEDDDIDMSCHAYHAPYVTQQTPPHSAAKPLSLPHLPSRFSHSPPPVTSDENSKEKVVLSNIEIVQAHKSVTTKRNALFSRTADYGGLSVTAAAEAKLAAAQNASTAPNWRSKMEEMDSEEEEENEKKFDLDNVDDYIHKQFEMHKKLLGDDFDEAAFDAAHPPPQVSAVAVVRNGSSGSVGKTAAASVQNSAQSSRQSSRGDEKFASMRHKSQLKPQVHGHLEIHDMEEEEKEDDCGNKSHDARLSVVQAKAELDVYHKRLLIRPKEAVGLVAANDFERHLLEQQLAKQHDREASINQQEKYIRQQMEEEKVIKASRAKLAVNTVKATRQILPPIVGGAYNNAYGDRPRIVRKVTSHRSDTPSPDQQQHKALSPGVASGFSPQFAPKLDSGAMSFEQRKAQNAWNMDMSSNVASTPLVHTPPRGAKRSTAMEEELKSGMENREGMRVRSPEYDESRDFRIDPDAERERNARKAGRVVFNSHSDFAANHVTAQQRESRDVPRRREPTYAPAPAINVHMGHSRPVHQADFDGYLSEEEDLSDDDEDSSPVRARRHHIKYNAAKRKKEESSSNRRGGH